MEDSQLGKIISWNINGFDEPPKRNVLFKWLKKQSCDLYCLQETHISNKHQKYLKNLSLEEVIFPQLIKRGVVIYAKKDLKPFLKFKDKEGSIVAIELNLWGKKVLIVHICS